MSDLFRKHSTALLVILLVIVGILAFKFLPDAGLDGDEAALVLDDETTLEEVLDEDVSPSPVAPTAPEEDMAPIKRSPEAAQALREAFGEDFRYADIALPPQDTAITGVQVVEKLRAIALIIKEAREEAERRAALDADEKAPSLALASKLDDLVQGELIIRAIAQDPVVEGDDTSGVAYVSFYVDGDLHLSVGVPSASSTYETSLDTTELDNGTHVLDMVVVDGAGNKSATTTVRFEVENVPDLNPFARGGVTLAFDTTDEKFYEDVAPSMAAYGMTGSLYVTTGLMNTTGSLTTEELVELQNEGWDVGSMGVHAAKLTSLPDSVETQEVRESKEVLENEGVVAESFALPEGTFDGTTLATVAKFYDSARHLLDLGGNNTWPYNKYYLQVRVVDGDTSVADVQAWVDEAIVNDQWLILTFEDVVSTNLLNGNGDAWSVAMLEDLLDYLEAQHVSPRTVASMVDQGPNMLEDGDFENGLAGVWVTNAAGKAVVDSNEKGAYPEAEHSLALSSGDDMPTYVHGPKVAVTSDETYGVRAFVDTRTVTAGEIGFYVDEYDENGSWVSGQRIGQAMNGFAVDEAYAYAPSSDDVKTAQLKVYVTNRTEGTAYLDSIEMFLP